MKKYLILLPFVAFIGCQKGGAPSSPSSESGADAAVCSKSVDETTNTSAALSGLQLKNDCGLSETDFMSILQDLD